MYAGSWESTREAFEWHEAKPSASLTSRVLLQLPKLGRVQSRHVIDARACVYRHLDARLHHTKSARKIANYALIVFFLNIYEVTGTAELL